MKVNFGQVFEGLVESFGDREAIVNVERNRRFTFLEYHLLTNRIANVLRDDLGLRAGDRYVCILNNDNLSLIHWTAAAKAEATCCHANYRDSLTTHLHQLKFVDAKVVFIEQDLLGTHHAALKALGLTVIVMDPPEHNEFDGILDFWSLVNAASDKNTNVELDDREHVALVRFTGGTTGESKCAMYCLDNLFMCRDSYWAVPNGDFHEDSRAVHLAPISHGSGMVVFPIMFQGGCNITINQPDLALWCQVVEREKGTHSYFVPTLAYRLLELREAKVADLSSLRSIIYSAAPMAPTKTAQLIDKFGPIFIQAYGSTENFSVATALTKNDHVDGGTSRLASAGRRIGGVEIRLSDEEGNQVKSGDIGEICIRSRGVCLGYLNNPEKTAYEFADGFWKSGDVGYFDSKGYLFIVDRKKDMIISGGFNIYATEVEAALSECPGVQNSVVVGIPDEDWGEAVHAEVILSEGANIKEETLISYVKNSIGSVKAPKSITFVDMLPMSAVGKVLRKDVRAKYWKKYERKV